MTATPFITSDAAAQAEKATLGAAIKSRVAYEQVARILTGADFAEPRHELIWAAIGWVNEQGTAKEPARADEVLVAARLHELDQLEKTGGALYLDDLVAAAVVTANAPFYARQVKQSARARALSILGTQLHQAGKSAGDTQEQDVVIGAAMEKLEHLGADTDEGLRIAGWDPVLDRLEGGDPGMPTGFTDLDELLRGGLKPGRVYVVAARPGGGKTAFAIQLALNAAERGTPVAFFSLEMSFDEDLSNRLIANRARINLDHLEESRLTEGDWDALSDALPGLVDLPLEVDDNAGASTVDVATQVASWVRRHRGQQGLVIVDYLQLLVAPGRHENRQVEVARITRAMKQLAKRHGVPIVLLSQLNRDASPHELPELSHLRESGAIEQDADVVVMLANPASGNPHHERTGELDVAVRKNRSGRCGELALSAQMHYAALADLAHASDREREEGF